MKKSLILAAMLTAGAYSASAQTSTTTTRQTTTTPATVNPDQTVTPAATTVESTTTTNDPAAMTVDTKGKGKTLIQPAPGTKVKGNGKRIKIK
jgi:cytolysin (calcineurin-like family phosphatase)